MEPQTRLESVPRHEAQSAQVHQTQATGSFQIASQYYTAGGSSGAMDFMHVTLYHGKRFRTLNVIDEGVPEALAIEVDTSLPAERFIRVLEQHKESRSLPRQIWVDNGPELISAKLIAWCANHLIRLHHNQPGYPMRNGYIERFNKSFRNEVLHANLFGSLSEVREAIHLWITEYNEERPHKSLGILPPSHYCQQLNQKIHPEL
jgi:putative transposase